MLKLQVAAQKASVEAQRQVVLKLTNGARPQEIAQAEAQLDAARANTTQAQAALDLIQAGARAEDIAQAQAQLRGAEVQLEMLRHQLSLSELVAPADAVVRSRLRQPGDMVSASTPEFALAMTQPKWVRIYVDESHLGRLKPGMSAQVYSDSDPDPVAGQVGYISSVAEFTPKSVQTEELRSSLAYEAHVILYDPEDRLRLGQPVTVHLDGASR